MTALVALTPTVSPFDVAALTEFYSRISSEHGMSVAQLQTELMSLFERPRPKSDLRDYRLSRNSWKNLADEVVPISKWLHFMEISSGRIRFPLNDSPPDAWLWHEGAKEPIGIEVTIAQARERFHLARELTSKKLGRGFIGVNDDAPQSAFDEKMAKPRSAYASTEVLSKIGAGIKRCLANKNKPKYAGFTLLIEAPLLTLPRDRWGMIKGELLVEAAASPFEEIFVVSNASDKPWAFQIK